MYKKIIISLALLYQAGFVKGTGAVMVGIKGDTMLGFLCQRGCRIAMHSPQFGMILALSDHSKKISAD
jgi:hypothetical protein